MNKIFSAELKKFFHKIYNFIGLWIFPKKIFSIICFIATIVIVPVYMWLLYNIKNSWTSNSHDTQGGSMTILNDGNEPKVTWMDPIIKKTKK